MSGLRTPGKDTAGKRTPRKGEQENQEASFPGFKGELKDPSQDWWELEGLATEGRTREGRANLIGSPRGGGQAWWTQAIRR